MKLYVFRAGRVMKCLLVLGGIVCAALLIFASSSLVASAVSQDRELPIYSVDCPEKTVAITFDCAWGADDIPDILNTLRAEEVKATFFIVGEWAEKFPEAVKAMALEGHDVANHSYSHPQMSTLGREAIASQLQKCTERLREISGQTTELFRAPSGDYNSTVIATARELGYYTIQWDVDSLDWQPGISRQEILSRVLQKVQKGSILLFHNDTPHTAAMMPEIIAALKREGYGFLPVSRMILRENYFIDFDGRQKRRE